MTKSKQIHSIIKFLLFFIFLTLFSCSDNKTKLKIDDKNKLSSNEGNVSNQTYNVLYTYIIPGMNVSFNYPSHKRIFLNQGENEHQSENGSLLINADVYPDCIIQINPDSYSNTFLKQFKKDNYHIDRKNMLALLRKNKNSILLDEETTKAYHEKRKFAYHDEIVGEEMFLMEPYFINYELNFLFESNLVRISVSFSDFDIKTNSHSRELIKAYPDLFYKPDGKYYEKKPEVSAEQLNYILFEEPEENLPEILLCFRKTVEAIRYSLYIPQYDKSYYDELINSGFSKDLDYEFIGSTSPDYMFISTRDKNNGNNLVVFKNGSYYGRYKDLDLKPVCYEASFIFNFDNFQGFYWNPVINLDEGLTMDNNFYPFIRW